MSSSTIPAAAEASQPVRSVRIPVYEFPALLPQIPELRPLSVSPVGPREPGEQPPAPGPDPLDVWMRRREEALNALDELGRTWSFPVLRDWLDHLERGRRP